MTETVVVAGAGHAAGQVAASLAQHRFAGRVVLLGDEPCLPYQRPPLSKKFLAGELAAERLYLKPASFYADQGINFRPGVRATVIDRPARECHTLDGGTFRYDALVLATGSSVRRLAVPGSDLAGIYYLRTIADVEAIRREAYAGRKLVIVGAGYIGLEVAAVCRGLGVDVTVLEVADRVMSRVVSPAVSKFYADRHEAHGVRLRLGSGVKEITGARGRLRAVVTTEDEELPCDFVVAGIGIVPNTGLAEAAGLEIDDGIVVDERCRTSDPRIYAAGDCTRHPSAIYGRRIRLESVQNAVEQARTAADNICGLEARYDQVPWFWSDQYDLKLQIAGLSGGYDATVLRGDPACARFACFYLKQGVLLAVDAINSPREFLQAKSLIANRSIIDPALLADPELPLKDLA